MYDIIFYHRTEWPDSALATAKELHPLAKVANETLSYNDIVTKYSKTIRTKMFWIIPTIQTLDFHFLNIVPSFFNRVFYLQDPTGTNIYLVPNKLELNADSFTSAKPLIATKYLKSPICYDVVFISYNETYADENWKCLKNRVPHANRINGISGIFNAHRQAAKSSATNFLWVVDADAKILDSFKFTHEVSLDHFDAVHVWHSRNPINGLEYGYGGIKLLPKHLLLDQQPTVDVTTGLSHNVKIIKEVSNITEFATTPFEAFKGAFRECTKLSSKIIDRQSNKETEERLDKWCVLNDSQPYGFYAYIGALAGKDYGQKNASNKEALSKINDFTWLQELWSLEISPQLPLHKQ